MDLKLQDRLIDPPATRYNQLSSIVYWYDTQSVAKDNSTRVSK